MARIAVLDENTANARLLAEALHAVGQEVLVQSPCPDLSGLIRFEPQAIVVSLYRRPEVTRTPIRHFLEEVSGAQTLVTVERHQAFWETPLFVVGHRIAQDEVPPHIDFDVFLACMLGPEEALPVVAKYCRERLERFRLGASEALPEAVPVREHDGAEVQICWGALPASH